MIPMWTIIVLAVYLFGGGFVSTCGAFHSSEYQRLIGEVEEGKFAEDVENIDQSQIRIVDQALAHRRAEELLGKRAGLGSQISLGHFSIQSVNGKLYWVAPLDHINVFRYFSNDTTPGYAMVSATNIRDAQIVMLKDAALRYGTSGFYFSKDLERHLYTNGYSGKCLDDYTFEIDDDGNPHYVITLCEKTIGFSGKDAIGVVIVDPTTGKFEEYSIKDTPAWVDRIQPESYVTDQLDWWGKYIHGYFNFGGVDKKQTTRGMSLVYTPSGKSMWYTGIQSVGKDEGTIGFVLVDTRTKEAKFYAQAGATETAAQSAIEGKVSNFGYASTFPILYNINGVPSYISTLKDKSGNYKMVGIAAVENRSIVATGDSFRDALRQYQRQLASVGQVSETFAEKDLIRLRATVKRLAKEVSGGTTYYYLWLDKLPGKIIAVTSNRSQEIMFTQKGDTVEIEYYRNPGLQLDVNSFDNLNINLD